ncbi:LysR family transcriptional regulator [Umboniibacter marinipuniceus]|uniref:DNA-binding transcriptional LysR family regulator n=1 Tax=Umboniibacter marinipuniceus TaxID=569599 RepID=A0A3M0AD18_9GAMM|nr:LysR family transcriptional regulator [Umboniibacter marinipuniceus]RMA82436.1 DNA-binding transcriptional LysR family regulator [Umboniibacter marinipuniceus]
MKKQLLDTQLLMILDAIDRRGSFARAAEELERTTAALSYSISKAEEQLGLTLFQRQGRRSVLTAAGELILHDGREILQHLSGLQDRAFERAQGWEPRIRIGLEATVNDIPFYQALSVFCRSHPNIEIELIETVLNGGWEALSASSIDLLVGVPGPIPPQCNFRCVKLNSLDMALVCAAKNLPTPVQTPHQMPADLTELGHLDGVKRVILRDTVQQDLARQAGLADRRYDLYVQTRSQKKAAILSGLGIGHLPRHEITHELSTGALVELARPLSTNLMNYVAWQLNHAGKATQTLAKLITEAYQATNTQ